MPGNPSRGPAAGTRRWWRIFLLLVLLRGAPGMLPAGGAVPAIDRVQKARELLREDESLLARWRAMVFALILRDGPGDRQAAVQAAEEASRRFPDSSRSWSLQAKSLLFQGRFRGAAEAARKALAIEMGNPEAQLVLGEVLMGRGRLDEAHDALQVSARLAPTSLEPNALLASLYERRKLYPLAADSWETYRRWWNTNPLTFSREDTADEGRIALLRAMGPRTPFSIDGETISTTVPMIRSRGGLYLVRVKPKRGRWEWFDVDSGSDGILISRELQRRWGLEEISETSVTGIGGKVVRAGTAILDRLTIGGLTIHNIPVEILDRFTRHKGRPIAGSLGQPFLREFVVTMNFPAGTFTLELPRRTTIPEADPPGAGRPALKYSIPMRYPSITVGEWERGGRIPMLWDTGAGMSVFDSRLLRQADSPGDPGGERKRGKDGTGEVISYRKLEESSWVRVDGFRFGVEPAIMDLGPVNHRRPYIGGIIGTDVMKDYILTLDYFRSELRLHKGDPSSLEVAGSGGGS